MRAAANHVPGLTTHAYVSRVSYDSHSTWTTQTLMQCSRSLLVYKYYLGFDTYNSTRFHAILNTTTAFTAILAPLIDG